MEGLLLEELEGLVLEVDDKSVELDALDDGEVEEVAPDDVELGDEAETSCWEELELELPELAWASPGLALPTQNAIAQSVAIRLMR